MKLPLSLSLSGRYNRFGVLNVVILLAPGLILVALSGVAVFGADSAPPGQILYRFAKVSGLLAGYLLCLQVVAGIANTMGLSRIWPWGRKGHILVFAVLTVLLFCHVGFYLAAVNVRTGSLPAHLLLPDFSQGYYRTSLSLGVIALACFVITALAGWRSLKGSRFARRMHISAYAAFLLVGVHSTNIGSETRFYFFIVILGATMILVVGLLCKRELVRRASFKLTDV